MTYATWHPVHDPPLKQFRALASMLVEDHPIELRRVVRGCTPLEVAEAFRYRASRQVDVGIFPVTRNG